MEVAPPPKKYEYKKLKLEKVGKLKKSFKFLMKVERDKQIWQIIIPQNYITKYSKLKYWILEFQGAVYRGTKILCVGVQQI